MQSVQLASRAAIRLLGATLAVSSAWIRARNLLPWQNGTPVTDRRIPENIPWELYNLDQDFSQAHDLGETMDVGSHLVSPVSASYASPFAFT